MEYVDFHIDVDIVCKLYQFTITSNIPFSAMIMVAIAVDRYLCICHPFLRIMTMYRARIITGMLGIFAAGLGVCVAVMYGVYQLIDHGNQFNISGQFLNESAQGWIGISRREELFKNESTQGWIGTEDWSNNYSVDRWYLNSSVERWRYGNISGNGSVDENNNNNEYSIDNIHHCTTNDLIVSVEFGNIFQKFYTATFLVCVVIVVVLYALIYRSVLRRRARREEQKSKSRLYLVNANNSPITSARADMTTTMCETLLQNDDAGGTVGSPSENNASSSEQRLIESQAPTPTPPFLVIPVVNVGSAVSGSKVGGKVGAVRSVPVVKRDSLANLRTAVMLFVVTVVFILAFLPAQLMALELIPYNMTIFYLYFTYNVANPVIYSFMNQNFRDNLKRLFCQ